MPPPISKKHYKNNVVLAFSEFQEELEQKVKNEKGKKTLFLSVFRFAILSLGNSGKVVGQPSRGVQNIKIRCFLLYFLN